MIIDSFDTDEQVLVIAEIGNNHEGSYSLAEELIGIAAKAGAGAVKFQTIVPDKLVSVCQKERIRQLENYRLSYEQFEKLSKVAKQEGVLFLSTPFDIESALALEPFVPAYKIASGDNNFYPMIDVIARTGKPIILSAGLASLSEIRDTTQFIQKIWDLNGMRQHLAVLHCVVSYPTVHRDANLLGIKKLQELGFTTGYSDHTVGIDAAVLSIALGARIVEKHFTISKTFSDFRDHKMSADPKEFSQLVDKIKQTVELLGTGEKKLSEKERESVNAIRRSIVAKRNLEKGKILTFDDVTWVRPGNGLPPGFESQLLGRMLTENIRKGQIILTAQVGTAKGE